MLQPISLRELYVRHAAELRGFLSSRLRCEETAADLTQEVFLRLSGPAGSAIHNPLAFAYRIARNLVVDHYRSKRRQPENDGSETFDNTPSIAPSPEEIAVFRQLMHRAEAAVEALPTQCRRAFVLNRFEGLSQVEVAERMGISRQMAERHIAKAILHLRARLEEPDAR